MRLPGDAGFLSPSELHAELKTSADGCGVDIERVFRWGKSLLTPASAMPDPALVASIDRYIPCEGYSAREYQVRDGCWAGMRMGSVIFFTCGVGKTATAFMALRAGLKLGTIQPTRVTIVGSLGACAVWRKYVPDLRAMFAEVLILSIDSAHNYVNIDPTVGGAFILDEAHKAGHADRGRTQACFKIRAAHEWGICLSGSLLHTGPEVIMNVQNLAIPGGSRVLDPMKFGKAFDCIAKTRLGPRAVKKLVRVPKDQRPALITYLNRLTIAKSFDSEEVASIEKVPGQTYVTIDEYQRPEWMPADAAWGPELPWQEYMGRLAVAMMHEGIEDMISFCERLGYKGDAPKEWLMKELENPLCEQDPRVIKKVIRFAGLPDITRLIYAMCREGRYDRCIVKEEYEIDGAKRSTYKFLYAPGTDRHNPGPGVKILMVRDWLEENPDEQVLLGAGGSGTVAVMSRMLTSMGIKHGLIEGGVPLEERIEMTKQFQDGSLRVMLVQEVAGGESITLTAAKYSFLIDHDYKPLPYTQYLGRIRRVGQKRESVHFDMAFMYPQHKLLNGIRDGHEFDSESRDALEAEYRALQR